MSDRPTTCDCEDETTGEPLPPDWTLLSETREPDCDGDGRPSRYEVVVRRYICDGCGARYEETVD